MEVTLTALRVPKTSQSMGLPQHMIDRLENNQCLRIGIASLLNITTENGQIAQTSQGICLSLPVIGFSIYFQSL